MHLGIPCELQPLGKQVEKHYCMLYFYFFLIWKWHIDSTDVKENKM